MVIRKVLILFGFSVCCMLQRVKGFGEGRDRNVDVLSELASLITPDIAHRINENIETLKRTSGTNSAAKSFAEKQRKLQDAAPERECGAFIGTITTEEMQSIAVVLLDRIGLDPFLAGAALGLLSDFLLNNVTVTKQCSSCAEVAQGFEGEAFLSDSNGFLRYCSSGSYGSNAVHSWLQFAPLDAENQLLRGTLRGFMAFRGLAIDVRSSPTERWPANALSLSEAVSDGQLSTVVELFDFVAAPLAAGAGALAMVPDYIGFGESYNFNRSFLTLDTYMQASAVTWLGAQLRLSSSAGGCTMMDNVATMYGVSEGGYAVVAGGYALERIGVRILEAHSIAGPLDLEKQIAHSIDSADRGIINVSSANAAILTSMPLLGFAFSNNYEFLANSNTGQFVLSTQWMSNVLTWFESGAVFSSADVIGMVPQDITALLNSDLVGQVRTAIANNTTPCAPELVKAGATDLMCQAIQENNAANLLESANFPVVLCFSQDDTFIPISQDLNSLNNTNIRKSELFPGLTVEGDHEMALIFCSLGPLIFFATSAESADAPNLVIPLDDESACLMSTSPPTPMPTPMPTPPSSSLRVFSVPTIVISALAAVMAFI